ncbi:MAG: NAD-dependent epimerase/dehydratase family protein [Steroidobacteraceae bacterium]
MQRPCLVAGCGYVGRRLAAALGSSRPVLALARSVAAFDGLERHGIQGWPTDFDRLEPGALERDADGAAIAYLAPPPAAGTDDPRLARFLAALGRARPDSLVYVSTTGVYGDAGGAEVDESSALRPSNDRARRRVAAESASQAWCAARGVRWVALRVPGIYGPDRLPIERLRRGEPALRPEDAGPGNRIHVDDLVAACIAALDRPVDGVVNVGDGDHASTTAFLQRTAALAGLPMPRLVTRDEARAQVGPGMLEFLLESRRVSTRRMREQLGVVPRHDLESGIAASLAEMGWRGAPG